MPYRVPEPERGRKFPRPGETRERDPREEEATREGPEGAVSLRRPGPPTASPWRGGFAAERPALPPAAAPHETYGGEEEYVPELMQFVVPESEWRDPTPKQVWTILPPPPMSYLYYQGEERRPSEAREVPRGAGPRPRPGGIAPSAARPPRRPEGPPLLDPRDWFDMDAIWNTIRHYKADSRFRPGQPIALIKISQAQRNDPARAADLIRYFRIPPSEVAKYPGQAIWDQLLIPFMDELSYAFEKERPNDIPGLVGFQDAKDGSFWMGYME